MYDIKKIIMKLWNENPKDYKGEEVVIENTPLWIPEEGEIRKPNLRWHRMKMDDLNNLHIWKF